MLSVNFFLGCGPVRIDESISNSLLPLLPYLWFTFPFQKLGQFWSSSDASACWHTPAPRERSDRAKLAFCFPWWVGSEEGPEGAGVGCLGRLARRGSRWETPSSCARSCLLGSDVCETMASAISHLLFPPVTGKLYSNYYYTSCSDFKGYCTTHVMRRSNLFR